jgi:hypothetical protein
MQPISLRGGSSVPAGVYREVHSGRMVYLGTPSTLPGQSNSEMYIQVPESALFNHRRQYLDQHDALLRKVNRA